ncbi:hypothetical protein QE109_04645 [Fusibacter bizertensis]|uniref:DUF2628 domain-containing protein n=1 Tax=Fusibacter bizertensis TaxID=1488331 RepID=A0ABT6NAH1_9FIRM|nr:hypothetical protein [Fusibacter bizertensis]MDH8677422.1 hypothetical protein [Fusibacter bizertensis]
MYSIKEKFVNECTAQGYIKSRKGSSTMYKRWIGSYILFVFIQLFILVKYNLLSKYGVLLAYADIALFLPTYVFAINSIFDNLKIKGFKKYNLKNTCVREYFKKQKEDFLNNIFIKKDKSLNFDKLSFYISWCEEMESSRRFEGLFEKAIIAGLTLPIWNKFVEMYLEETSSYSSSEFLKFVLILFIITGFVFIVSLFLKNTIALMYLDYHNTESEEFKGLKRSLKEYFGKHKFE